MRVPVRPVGLFRTGTSLGGTGLVAAARDHFQDLHTTATSILGPDHPDTLTARHNLAFWRRQAGLTEPPSEESAM